MARRWAWACASIATGCLFPSLDGLSSDAGTLDAGSDTALLDGPSTDGPIDPALVAYYPFDEGTGLVAHDFSGHGFDAVIQTNAGNVWTTGHVGGAIQFGGTTNTCVVVTSLAANQVGPLTVTAWINALGPINGVGGYVVGQRNQTGYAWRTAVTDTSGAFDFAVGITTDAGQLDDYANTSVPLNAWHHTAGVFDPSGPRQAVYIDGIKALASSPAPSILADPTGATIRIGCRGDDSQYFNGTIDEVRVYSRALSDLEIAALAAH